jgi:glutamate/aspartate transport system substrate-binding protein
LKLTKLDVKLTPVTSENRITLVQNGVVDLECGSTTNTTERQKQVSFSNTIFVVGNRLMVKANSGIKDFADLAGKTVVTTAGTTSERLLRKMNESSNMKMKVISAKDHGEAFLTLESGRAAAFVMDEVLLYGELAKARNASDWVVVGTSQLYQAYACMMRKDDPAFKKIVDAALAKVMTSGEAEKLYAKWFLQPIPPKGLNLNFQMAYALKKLYKSPNDKAYD